MSVSDENLAELFEQYKDEVRETIEALDNELVAIEQDSASSETIFSLFRHMHSLKGSSRMFNVDNIAHIAHRLEDLMSMIDKNNSILGSHPKIIDLLFKGNDIFRDIIARLEQNIDHIRLTPEHTAFIEELQAQVDKIKRRDGRLPEAARKLLDDLEHVLPALEEAGGRLSRCPAAGSAITDPAAPGWGVENLKKSMADLSAGLSLATLEEDGSSQFHYNGADLTGGVKTLEGLLDKFKKNKGDDQDAQALSDVAGDLYNAISDVATEDAQELIAELGAGLYMFKERHFEVDEMMVEFFDSILNDLKAKFQVETLVKEPGARRKKSSGSSSPNLKEPQAKTIRVDEAKIDQFLESVGKLITKSESLNHLQFAFREAGLSGKLMRDFVTVTRTISNDVVNLQRSIMEVRQVEINNILKKFPRLVRDISHKIGKEAELAIRGEKTPIDKSLLDDVEQALLHIVRNAVDHGLEMPEEREAGGKNRRGAIDINVTQQGASVLIEVSDDGQGLNLERVRNKAVKMGVISPEQAAAIGEKETETLIFRSGLSTKDEATDLSGRGVGLDVVMTNMKKWNGEVTVGNIPGQGLTIGLKLPVTNTLLTKEAILLRVADSAFCLPLEFVSEIVTVPSTAIHIHKDRAVFRHRNMVISVINIKEMLGLGQSDYSAITGSEKESRAFVILRNGNDSRRSIMADEILGQQKIVIKEFELEIFRKLPYFSGLTLLGDGRVVLILNSEKIMAS